MQGTVHEYFWVRAVRATRSCVSRLEWTSQAQLRWCVGRKPLGKKAAYGPAVLGAPPPAGSTLMCCGNTLLRFRFIA